LFRTNDLVPTAGLVFSQSIPCGFATGDAEPWELEVKPCR
jgi:hypothetical protein